MAKLVEIAVREIAQWDDDWVDIIQNLKTGMVSARKKDRLGVRLRVMEIGDDCNGVGIVTRAQWEAGRARQLAELSKFTEQDKAHIQELTDIACGEFGTFSEKEWNSLAGFSRTKEDQALWDKVAAKVMAEMISSARAEKSDVTYAFAAEASFNAADAFMAEREKRLKGVE